MITNKVILTGTLTEVDFAASKSGRLFAKANIAIGRGKSTTVIPIIFGGRAAEVLATEVEIGDRIRISGRAHGHDTGREGSKSIALILSESVRKDGRAT